MAPEPDSDSPLQRFERSLDVGFEAWHDGVGYDLGALAAASTVERARIEELLLARGARGWRDVEALAALDTPRARAVLARAAVSGDSVVRLAVLRYAPEAIPEAAEASTRTAALVAALENDELFGGLSAALDLAVDHHPPPVLEALWRGLTERDGEAAVHFAALLAFLHGRASEPFDWELRPLFLRFATEDPAERLAARAALCDLLGVPSPGGGE